MAGWRSQLRSDSPDIVGRAMARGGGIAKRGMGQALKRGGKARNTRRMNRLEELGRVDAERGRTRKGKRNLKAEKRRIVRELKK
jgi:hypothetical protein